jgi:drug/metabolite transporter (DMT)-like permease
LSPHTLIMLLTSGQILTVLLAVVFLGEAPTLKTWLGIGLVVAGITVVLWAKLSGERQASQLRGVVLGILSVVCMSVSMVIAKKGLAEISAMQGLFIRMLAAGLTMLLLSTFQWRAGNWLAPFRQSGLLWQFFASVCVITFGGFWLSLLALEHLPVSIANTLNSAEPLFVLPLGVCFLREKVTLAALTGSVVAVAGISLLCMS